MQRQQGIYYDEETCRQWPECCDKCHDVAFEKTYPAHSAYHACLNIKCKCHMTPQQFLREVEEEAYNQLDWDMLITAAKKEYGRLTDRECMMLGFAMGQQRSADISFLRSQFSRLLEEVEKKYAEKIDYSAEENGILRAQMFGAEQQRKSMLTTLKEWKEGVGVGGEEGHEEVKIR